MDGLGLMSQRFELVSTTPRLQEQWMSRYIFRILCLILEAKALGNTTSLWLFFSSPHCPVWQINYKLNPRPFSHAEAGLTITQPLLLWPWGNIKIWVNFPFGATPFGQLTFHDLGLKKVVLFVICIRSLPPLSLLLDDLDSEPIGGSSDETLLG